MPVSLSVSQIRDELFRALPREDCVSKGVGAQFGRWFHELFALLLGPDRLSETLAALADADRTREAWSAALLDLAYRRFVGPKLAAEQAILRSQTPAVLVFWQAIGALTAWLASILWTTHDEGFWSVDELPASCERWAEFCLIEQPLSCVIERAGWSDRVRLNGTADAILRIPRSDRWCVVELKLAGQAPAVDLAQVCLYRWMFQAQLPRTQPAAKGAVCLVRFEPTVNERMFEPAELAETETRLIALIGKLAGVVRGGASLAGAQPAAPGVSMAGRPAPSPPVPAPAKPLNAAGAAAHGELGQKLVAALREYGAAAELAGPPIVGPTFIRFPLQPARGVRVAAIERSCDDLQARLGLADTLTTSIARGQLYIDIPRPERQFLSFGQIAGQLAAPDRLFGVSKLPIGVDIGGRLHCADFAAAEHGHLLVAGTTGSGKTEWLRVALAGLIATNTPETLRLVLIDPKRNAFHELRSSRFLWGNLGVVYPDELAPASVFARLVDEMTERYQQMEGCDDIGKLVVRLGKPIPRIVCVCDEYYDVITRPRKERLELEEHNCRLGAKARAAGIHLMLATQQPSRQVIKGVLDANIPCRVGLRVQNPLESRMLLNVGGAERLLGRGDLLFKSIGDPIRLQAAYLTDAERKQYLADS